jgi:dimethylargininase
VALVRAPSPHLASGIVTHITRDRVDADLALVQWRGYVAALADAGWKIAEASPLEECPDGVFIEDTMVVYRDVAVIGRPGAGARRAETATAQAAVAALGMEIAFIREPGTLDGGDVLKIGDTIYVGRSGRTNAEGARQLRELLEPRGATVVQVPVTRVLHLKSAVTALPDGTIIGYPPLVDDEASFSRFLAVPEESGSHVVLLGGNRLLMAADAPQSARLFSQLGYEPVLVDISEFQKMEGCVTCLSVRIRSTRS